MSGPTPRQRPEALRWARASLALLLGAALLSGLSTPSVGAATAASPTSYQVPCSDFNITDHNLTFTTNEVVLDPPAPASFVLTLQNHLVSSPAIPPALSEAELSMGPGPTVGDETDITPILIVQEAATGLLRIEFIPFAMNDTYGFLVYQGYPVPPGPSAFSSHTLTLRFNETGTPVAPYLPWGTYGNVTGYLDVSLDARLLTTHYPITWSTLASLYGYGLRTDSFVGGDLWANLTGLPPVLSSSTTGPSANGWSPWLSLGLAAFGGVFLGALLAFVLLRFGARKGRGSGSLPRSGEGRTPSSSGPGASAREHRDRGHDEEPPDQGSPGR